MTTDQTAPATKQDFLDLIKYLDGRFAVQDKRVRIQDERFAKQDERIRFEDERFDFQDYRIVSLTDSIEDLRGDMIVWKEELKLHFDVVAETLRHDYLSANRDEMTSLKQRVSRLEKKTGVR